MNEWMNAGISGGGGGTFGACCLWFDGMFVIDDGLVDHGDAAFPTAGTLLLGALLYTCCVAVACVGNLENEIGLTDNILRCRLVSVRRAKQGVDGVAVGGGGVLK